MAINGEPLPGDTSTSSEPIEALDTDDVVDRYEHRGRAEQESAGSPRPDKPRRGGPQPGGADDPERRQR